ncbi:MAG: acyltransferase [Muribaculaceae bacterium]|nr:acyltransferase [Muribaculaceae bacterium]
MNDNTEVFSDSHNPMDTPKKKVRNSNLELYRIIVMILIVAHHYVVNSGLFGMIQNAPISPAGTAMLIFGGWGKTGIDCFLLISGYFLCTSSLSWRKLLKLYLQITFYAIIIYIIFCFTGHEHFSIFRFVLKLNPIEKINNNYFVSCFLLFYLFIPFINILLKALTKAQHKKLVILLLIVYTILPSHGMSITFNYVSWFVAIYIMAAYIRWYGLWPKIRHSAWGWMTILLAIAGAISVFCMEYAYKAGLYGKFDPYFFIADSNKLLSVGIAVSSFMYFKDLKLPYSRLINAVGAATFGVLLIHANSEAMRTWLWKETIDTTGHFGDSVMMTLGYAMVSVVLVFVLCAGIDWFRGRLIEPFYIKYAERCARYLKPRLQKILKRLKLT